MVNIRIGIPTAGKPVIERRGENTVLKNMLIGKDFHWQRAIEATLPGITELSDDPEFPVINAVDVETYLRCVVGSEMNPKAPAEFLKAHAVISRSWVLGKVGGVHDHSSEGKIRRSDRVIDWNDTEDHVGFHVCSDDHCQRYQGLQPLPEATARALKATEGEVVVDRKSGHIVDTRFSKCCGGKTELFSTCWQDREEPGLESFDDPWCDLSGLSPAKRKEVLEAILKDYDQSTEGGYRWETDITGRRIRENLLNKFNIDSGRIESIKVLSRGPSGRARLLQVVHDGGHELKIGKELMIRRLLAASHLYSSWIEIEKGECEGDESTWKIRGRGWGHGVGLCQIGAARMALEGYTYKEILDFYYPGSQIEVV